MPRSGSDWWGELDEMQRQMEKFLDHVGSCKRQPVKFAPGVWQPLVDVYETPDEVVVVADVAGVVREDIRIVLHDRTLLLTGERRDRRAGTPRLYKVREVNYGRFEREVELPAPVVPDSANANLESGFLVIVMIKDEPRTRNVRVVTGKEVKEREQ